VLDEHAFAGSFEGTEGPGDDDGPTKFKIEVQGRAFVFDAQTNHDLMQWTQALFQNWAAGEAL
jgi:hypothetical protein